MNDQWKDLAGLVFVLMFLTYLLMIPGSVLR